MQLKVPSNKAKAFIYLFGVLHRFQHCTGDITKGSWKGRVNHYIQFVRVLYCKLLTNGKQLPAFPLEAMLGTKPRPQRWEARVLPLCHRGPRLLSRIARTLPTNVLHQIIQLFSQSRTNKNNNFIKFYKIILE